MPQVSHMAKKSSGESAADLKHVNVRLPADLHRDAKAVAAYLGRDLAEYVEAIVRPAVERDFDQVQRGQLAGGERAAGGADQLERIADHQRDVRRVGPVGHLR